MKNNHQLEQIADRIKYLRDILDISAEELAKNIDMPLELFLQYENCEKDIPVSMIYSVAAVLNIDPTELLTGERPRMDSYSVTRKGHGIDIERFEGYGFESLAFNFKDRNKEPMLVTITPSETMPLLVTHGGQEFNFVLTGKIAVILGSKTIELNKGDSIYFDPKIPHGQIAIDGEAKFLTVIDKE
ncbi:XRE family transcriptional regulator [Eubacteriales bacterium OttesenSCG-928-G02]|nr:XRE family transcriptional regulator [Eubacteriales bacterium OttesenSCG-928-G02]